jgi:hypothetical protein
VYRFSELLAGSFANPRILWFGLPLILTIIIVELYLDLRKRTGAVLLGNIAVLNAVVLGFVGLDMLRLGFSEGKSFLAALTSAQFFLAILVIAIAAALFILDSVGKFPRKTFWKFSAHLPFNITGYTAMVAAYNGIPIDFLTIISWLLLMVFFWAVFALMTMIKFKFKSQEKQKDKKKGKPEFNF